MTKRFRVTKSGAVAAISLLIGLVLLWTVLRMAPVVTSSLGMRGGYEFTFLRWGSMYTEVHPGAWLFGSPKRRSSLAFANAGERIVLKSQTSIEQGRVVLSVYSGTWGGNELHNKHLTSSGPYGGEVSVPKTGFYRVTANYVFTFRGRHDLDWRVE